MKDSFNGCWFFLDGIALDWEEGAIYLRTEYGVDSFEAETYLWRLVDQHG